LYRERDLLLRKRNRKRIGLGGRSVLPKPRAPNLNWSMDYVSGTMIDGKKLRALMIVNDLMRECLAIEVDASLPGGLVVMVLERLCDLCGLPSLITMDHGPEFEVWLLNAWAYKRGVRLAFIRTGKSADNWYTESFNRDFRNERLNEHWFISMQRAHSTDEDWRIEYNTERTHRELKDLTAEEFGRAHASAGQSEA
jgi:putative transposase